MMKAQYGFMGAAAGFYLFHVFRGVDIGHEKILIVAWVFEEAVVLPLLYYLYSPIHIKVKDIDCRD
jgi:hypothetical protein